MESTPRVAFHLHFHRQVVFALPRVMNRLSNEVLEHLLSYLCHVDIEACRLTCRQFRAVINGSILLRYICRLQLAARTDHELSSSHLSVARRLSALNDLENAWLRADFTPLSVVRFPLNTITYASSMNGALYLLTGTIWESEEIMRLPTLHLDEILNEGPRLRLTNGFDSLPGTRRVVKEVDVLWERNLLTVVSV